MPWPRFVITAIGLGTTWLAAAGFAARGLAAARLAIAGLAHARGRVTRRIAGGGPLCGRAVGIVFWFLRGLCFRHDGIGLLGCGWRDNGCDARARRWVRSCGCGCGCCCCGGTGHLCTGTGRFGRGCACRPTLRRAILPFGGDAILQQPIRTKTRREASGRGLCDLDQGLVFFDPDLADLRLVQIARPTQKRQKPTRLGTLGAADREREPDRGAKGLTLGPRAGCGRCAQILGRGQPSAVKPQTGGRDLFRAMGRHQLGGKGGLGLVGRIRPKRIIQKPCLIQRQDLVRRGGKGPFRLDLGPFEQPRGLVGHLVGHDHRRDALAARAPRAPRAVQKRLGVGGQIGMDHQIELGQVDAACRHIGGHANPRAPIAHRLQRMAALILAQLTRQADNRKPAIGKARRQTCDRGTRIGEHDGRGRIVKTQKVDDPVLGILGRDLHHLIADIGMLAAARQRGDAHRVALELLGKLGNRGRHSGREQERAPLGRGSPQHEFQIFAKAQIQHLIGLIEHDGADIGQIEHPAHDMVAQAPRRADDDMCATLQRAAFLARVHAADARHHTRACLAVKPSQFALHLHRQFARRRDDQRQGCGGRAKAAFVAHQGRRNGKAKADSFARTRLRRDKQIGLGQFWGGDGLLNICQHVESAFGEGFGQGRYHGEGSVGNARIRRNLPPARRLHPICRAPAA